MLSPRYRRGEWSMSHTIRDKQKLKARANKIQGQVNALKNMLDEPHECSAVLQQIAAIRGAVNGLMREVIKGHLTEHIVHEEDEAQREADLDVVLKVLDSYIK
jgi:DNA-binding FrmR family transcriptional regulator